MFVSTKQGHIDVPLSQYAQAFRNLIFVGERFFPRVPVNKQSDKYWKWGRENIQLPPSTLRAPGAAAQRILQSISTENYNAEDQSLERFITDEERGNFDPGNVEQWATKHLTERLLLAKEKLFADSVSDTAKIPQNVTLSGASQWSDISGTSNPIDDVQAGIEVVVKNSGVRPNRLVIGFEVFSKLRIHPKIVERIQNVKLGIVTVEDLAALFAIPEVIVSQAHFQPLGGGASGFVFGKHAFLAFAQDAPSPEDVSFGKSFVWNAPGTSQGFQVEIGRAAPVSRKSDEIAVHFYYDQKIVATETAYLIKNAVA